MEKSRKYRILLYLLRVVIYIKRGLVWLAIAGWFCIEAICKWLGRMLGLKIYKIYFVCRKWLDRFLPKNNYVAEFLGKRGTLQILLLILILFIAFPDSKLYTRTAIIMPGQGTFLYKIVGPGPQDFPLEETGVEIVPAQTQTNVPSWTQGAVKSQPGGAPSAQVPAAPETIALGAGGTAVLKPTIIPGAALPAGPEGTVVRTGIVLHEVKTGETVSGLADKYKISIATILWSNNLSAYSYIRPGDKLKILPMDGITHKIKKGDNVAKIAKLYKAKEDDIIKFNRLQKDGSDIVISEELIIPYGVKPQPVYIPQRVYTALSDIAAPPPSLSVPAGAGYIWPTTARRITQYFGWRHAGIDIAGPVGTPVYAVKSGQVLKSQCGWNGGYGCIILIDHGGVQTVYAHNSRHFVKAGDEVVQGQTISAMGSTGRSTGSHLHFEVRVGGTRVNPLRYVK